MLTNLADQSGVPEDSKREADLRAAHIDVIAQVIGAVVLSRACPDDSPLADEILDVCRAAVLSRLSSLDL